MYVECIDVRYIYILCDRTCSTKFNYFNLEEEHLNIDT